MAKYKFTDAELHAIFETHEFVGPRDAYRKFHNDYSGNVRTLDVEDFIIAFYSQYNSRIRNYF